MMALERLTKEELLDLGGLRSRCSASLRCTAHGLNLPCELCEVESGASAGVVCTACGHAFVQGVLNLDERACQSVAMHAATGNVAFPDDAEQELQRREEQRRRQEAELQAQRQREQAERERIEQEARERERIEREREQAQREQQERLARAQAERERREAEARARELAELEARAQAERAERERVERALSEEQERRRAADAEAERHRAEAEQLRAAEEERRRLEAVRALEADRARRKRRVRAVFGAVTALAVGAVAVVWWAPEKGGQSPAVQGSVAQNLDESHKPPESAASNEAMPAAAAPDPSDAKVVQEAQAPGWVPAEPSELTPEQVAQERSNLARRLQALSRSTLGAAFARLDPGAAQAARAGEPQASLGDPGRAGSVARLADLAADVLTLMSIRSPEQSAAREVTLGSAIAALQAMPLPARGDRKTARRLHSAGLELLGQQGFEQLAIDRLDEALQADPLDIQIRNDLAYAQLAAGQTRESIGNLLATLRQNPRRTSAWANLAEAVATGAHAGEQSGDVAAGLYVVAFYFSENRARTMEFLSARADAEGVSLSVRAAATLAQRFLAVLEPPMNEPSVEPGTSAKAVPAAPAPAPAQAQAQANDASASNEKGMAAEKRGDYAQAVAWYREAAVLGDAAGQGNLGAMYMNGSGVARDEREAVAWLRKAAGQGNARGQNGLGYAYRHGLGVAKDEREAVAWFRKAAEQGDARGQVNLGLMHELGRGVAKDERAAVAWYRKAAELGAASGQDYLGVMYANGLGVGKDEREAVAWFRKAAEQGNARGQVNLGFMYQNGLGVAKDEQEAIAWYRKAAEEGSADGQYNVGLMYDNGLGVAKDERAAVAWYRRAAEQGHATGQVNLGVMYAMGRGVAKDERAAAAWFRKAAEQGNADGQYNVGFMYDHGHGVAEDEREAVAWFRKAAEQGHELARKRLGIR